MKRTILTAAAVVALATTTACSSSTSGGVVHSTSSTGSSGQHGSTAVVGTGPMVSATQLRSQLLSLSDMPSGWSSTTDTSNDDSGNGGCAAIEHASYRTLPAHAEADFVQGSDLPELDETLASGTSAQLATAWSSWQTAVQQCHQLTFDAQGQKVTLKLAPMSFPKIGDDSTAVSATGSIEGFDFSIDIVAWRTKTAVGDVVLSDLGDVDVATLEKVTKTAAAKMGAE